MANTTKTDPIKIKYYDPIENSEKFLKIIFWVSLIFSFLIVLIDKKVHPVVYNWAQISFCTTVIVLFAVDLFNRLYLKTRADDMRIKDFLSHAYKIELSHVKTEGYYNNNEIIPRRRIAAQLLENAIHSKTTALEMVKFERIKISGYLLIWIIAVLNRSTDLEFATIAAQTLFGEYLISYYIRIEWIRIRAERVYEDIYNLFQSNPNDDTFEIKTLEGLVKYETTKSCGGILLSSKVFDLNNQEISAEWEKVKKILTIS